LLKRDDPVKAMVSKSLSAAIVIFMIFSHLAHVGATADHKFSGFPFSENALCFFSSSGRLFDGLARCRLFDLTVCLGDLFPFCLATRLLRSQVLRNCFALPIV
jgi:hypothetical protein